MNTEISDRLDGIDEAVQWAQDERPGAGSRGTNKPDYEDFVADLMDDKLGPVKDLTREIRELLETHAAGDWAAPETPPDDVPEPPAEPQTNYMDGLQGVATAATHWEGNPRAADIYTRGGEGTLIAMPLGGTVTMLTTPTPGGPMYTAFFQADNGATYCFGHVNEYEYRQGRVEANVPFARQGVSGLRNILQYRPSHIHFFVCEGHVTTDADGMGDYQAVQSWQALGFGVGEWLPAIPGPQDYLTGRWYAGRRVG